MGQVRWVVPAVVIAAACGGCGSAAHRSEHEGADHRARLEAGDPDRGHEGRDHNPNGTAYADGGFPKRYITAKQTLRARRAYQRLHKRWKTADFRRGTKRTAARAA